MLLITLKSTFIGTTLARFCSMVLLAIVVLALVGPTIIAWDADEVDWQALETPPSIHHWFGTDLIGRDLFVRTLIGARVSIGIAIVATLVSILIGIPWGAIAGYLGGRTDQIMMRVVDTLYALPFILVVILLVVVFGREASFCEGATDPVPNRSDLQVWIVSELEDLFQQILVRHLSSPETGE